MTCDVPFYFQVLPFMPIITLSSPLKTGEGYRALAEVSNAKTQTRLAGLELDSTLFITLQVIIKTTLYDYHSCLSLVGTYEGTVN